jgi:hypothetical protein
MRHPRDYTGYQTIHLEPEVATCPKCNGPVRLAYQSNRHVAFLRQRHEFLYDARRCPNPSCAGPANRFLPAMLQVGMLPKYEFGLDVIAFIGEQRLRKHATFPDLAQTLRRDYGVPISDRRVQDLFDLYMALISTPLVKDPERLARLRAQGRIVLAIDAAQPDMDAESLWVLRDTLSEEVIEAFSAASMDARKLAERLRDLKALGIPVTGVISDAQNIIVDAVELVFPGVPYQLCQLHFLRDFAKAVTATDQGLKTDLAKQLRGLSAFEKAAAEKPPTGPLKAPKSVTLTQDAPDASPRPGRPRTHVRLHPPRTPEERDLVRHVSEILRAVLKHHGRYPLQAPGLETRDLLQQVHEALDAGLKKKGVDLSFSSNSVSTSPSL